MSSERPGWRRDLTGGDGRRLVVALGIVLVAGAVLVSALAGVAVGEVGGADRNEVADSATLQESEPPELAGGERLNDTAVKLVVADDSGVDVGSIDRSEFLVSAGEIESVSARQVGSDAHVVVRLTGPIDADELTVAVRDNSEIQDVQGNRIDTSAFVGVTIDGMDAVAPSLRRMEVPEYASDEIEYRLVFDEPVDSFAVAVGGPRELSLGREDFERLGRGQYRLTYEPPVDGVYTFEVQSATDQAGNTDTYAASASTEVQSAAVRAVASIDLSATSGLTFTFDASQSEQRARAYIWDFGDGETASGQRVSHTYAPGNYTVRLEVIDEFGNVGTDRLTLNLTGNRTGISPGDRRTGPVTVDRSGSPLPTEAQVTVSESDAGEPLTVRAESVGQPLIASEAVSLEELIVTPADSGQFGLGLSVLPAEDERIAAAGDVAGGEVVAGFVARPTVSDRALSIVRLRFSVDRTRLDDLGVAPENVSLYRTANGSWNAESTSVRSISRNRASFEATTSGFSRFAVVALTGAREDADADEDSSDDDTGSDSGVNGQDDTQTGDDTDEQPDAVSNDQFTVRNVTLSDTSIEPGEAVEVQAEIVNNGSEPGDYVAALAVEGTVVQSQEVLRIPPDGESLPVTFTRQINETGTVQLSINGTAAPGLTVGEDDGGLLSFLSILPLGFLPWGLIRTLLTYVVAPLLLVGGILKGVASYLGY
jgi:hypothetical protein